MNLLKRVLGNSTATLIVMMTLVIAATIWLYKFSRKSDTELVQKTFHGQTQVTIVSFLPGKADPDGSVNVSGTTTRGGEPLSSRLVTLIRQASIADQCGTSVEWLDPLIKPNVRTQQIDTSVSINFDKFVCGKTEVPQVVCKDVLIELPFGAKTTFQKVCNTSQTVQVFRNRTTHVNQSYLFALKLRNDGAPHFDVDANFDPATDELNFLALTTIKHVANVSLADFLSETKHFENAPALSELTISSIDNVAFSADDQSKFAVTVHFSGKLSPQQSDALSKMHED